MAYSLKQALSILESGQPCQLRFITADVTKGTGGKVIELDKCRIARGKPAKEGDAPNSAHENTSGVSRGANHSYNFTRNIELPNKLIRKVHPILITHINNQAVL